MEHSKEGKIKAQYMGDTDPLHKEITSNLPYLIAKHRNLAENRFCHARSKEHGLKHLDIRSGWLAIFWLITFVSVISLLGVILNDIVTSYLAMPVATQIKSEHASLQFPDVTVCPKSPFSSNMSKSEWQKLERLQAAIKQKLKDAGLHDLSESVQAAVLIQLATEDSNSIPRGYEHLVYCSYDGNQCSFANFTELIHLRYMQCFTFSPLQRYVRVGQGLTFAYWTRRTGKPFMLLNDLENPMFKESVYDGVNVFIHNPGTFPTYKISQVPTSFPLRYGQIVHLQLSGLQYTSDMSGRKSCTINPKPYRYKNYRGGANFVEYGYTFEDCVANRKQQLVFSNCECHSDHLFVPFDVEIKNGRSESFLPKMSIFGRETRRKNARERANSTMTVSTSTFCRDIRGHTSEKIRNNFFCHNRMVRMATTSVLDEYIAPDMLYKTTNEPDKRKGLRYRICSVPCHKMIYHAEKFEINDLDDRFNLGLPALYLYFERLEQSNLRNRYLEERWDQFKKDPASGDEGLPGSELIIVDIRVSRERVDRWQEELTKSAFNLMADIGGTLGLCTGISFLSSFFLLIFFGNAFYHGIVAGAFWFWWTIFEGQPPPTPSRVSHMNHENENDGCSSSMALRTQPRLRAASKAYQRQTGSHFTQFSPGPWIPKFPGSEWLESSCPKRDAKTCESIPEAERATTTMFANGLQENLLDESPEDVEGSVEGELSSLKHSPPQNRHTSLLDGLNQGQAFAVATFDSKRCPRPRVDKIPRNPFAGNTPNSHQEEPPDHHSITSGTSMKPIYSTCEHKRSQMNKASAISKPATKNNAKLMRRKPNFKKKHPLFRKPSLTSDDNGDNYGTRIPYQHSRIRPFASQFTSSASRDLKASNLRKGFEKSADNLLSFLQSELLTDEFDKAQVKMLNAGTTESHCKQAKRLILRRTHICQKTRPVKPIENVASGCANTTRTYLPPPPSLCIEKIGEASNEIFVIPSSNLRSFERWPLVPASNPDDVKEYIRNLKRTKKRLADQGI